MKPLTLWMAHAAIIASLCLPQGLFAAQVQPTELESITVTAEKRETPVQEIPASISVVSDMQISDANLSSTLDLARVIPNLYITNTGNGAMTNFIALRGITGSMTGTPAVGFYVDDVYYPAIDMALFDVERVEVLKGPQGTLYGRNSEAGVIHVVTKRVADTPEATLGLDVSSFSSYAAQASVNAPLSKKLGVRAAVKYAETDGYFENSASGSHEAGREENLDSRIALSLKATDALSFELTTDYQSYQSPQYANFAALSSTGNLRKNITVDEEGKLDKEAMGTALKADWNLGGVKLVSITSYRDDAYLAKNDMDFTPVDLMTLSLDKKLKTLSQEFRLLSNSDNDRVQWIGGLFLLNEDDDRRYEAGMNFGNMGMPGAGKEIIANLSTRDTTSVALFGESTFGLTDTVALTLGLRYDREEKDFSFKQIPGGPVSTNMKPAAEGTRDDAFDAWLPKASLQFRPSEQCMPYITVSRGFRSGGFNDKENLGSSFAPEFTWNYEVGVKTKWLDNRLQANASLFYIDWSDMQVEVLIDGGSSVFTDNAGEARSKGAELELLARPVHGLTLTAGASWVDATYEDYSKGTEVFDGNHIIDSPQYTANVGGTYRFSNGFMANARYVRFGKIYFDPANTRSQEDYGVVDAKVGYESDRLDIYLYGRNLLDEDYLTRAFARSGNWYGRAAAPRTVGVNLTTRF